jgi:hypothetical protein
MNKIKNININIKLDCWHLLPYQIAMEKYNQYGVLCFEIIIIYK